MQYTKNVETNFYFFNIFTCIKKVMKKALIKNLKNDTYCRLKPDSHGGVGVFAIKNIPKGTNPFHITNHKNFTQRILNIPDEEVKKMDPAIIKMISDFYVKSDDNGFWGIPYKGLNANDISFYLNNSEKPNLKIIYDNESTMLNFKTSRQINIGEELLIDYREYK